MWKPILDSSHSSTHLSSVIMMFPASWLLKMDRDFWLIGTCLKTFSPILRPWAQQNMQYKSIFFAWLKDNIMNYREHGNSWLLIWVVSLWLELQELLFQSQIVMNGSRIFLACLAITALWTYNVRQPYHQQAVWPHISWPNRASKRWWKQSQFIDLESLHQEHESWQPSSSQYPFRCCPCSW